MLTRFLKPEDLRRLESFEFAPKLLAEGYLSGQHRSHRRGSSIEFREYRQYTPGDDPALVDWRVFARSDRHYVRTYEQETNFTAHVLLDGSKSMEYGDGATNKLEFAKLLVATLTYVIVKQRDSVGLNVFDRDWRVELPPSSSMANVNTILHTLEAIEPQEKTSIGPLLEQLADRVRRRGLIFIVSDMFDEVDSLLKGLKHLRFSGHDVTVFHVLHPDEIDFPFAGSTRFEGMEELPQLLCDPRALRDGYLEALEEYLTEVRRGCARQGIDYALTRTGDYLDAVLSKFLHHRMALKASAKARANV